MQSPPAFITENRRKSSATAPISSFNASSPMPSPVLKLSPRVPPKNLDLSYKIITPPDLLPSQKQRSVHRPPPLKLKASNKNVASAISSPIPHSVTRSQVTINGQPVAHGPPVATISLAEAQRRQKPLPQINPMTPSDVHGFEAVGNWADISADEEESFDEKREEPVKKTGFGNFMRLARKCLLGDCIA